MSTSNTTSDSTTQPNGRKRLPPNYARVAIPLPLSKSKTNGQPGPTVKGNVNGESKESQAQKTQVDTPEPSKVTVVSENTERDDESNGVHAASAPNSGMATPASSGEPVVAAHEPSTLRRPTQLRTQLPPDFVPSNGHPTPQTAGSESSPAGSQGFITGTQTAKAGAARIVFGSDSSNNPSPVPPAYNVFTPPRQVQHHSPHASVFMPPSHAHHLSEPYHNYSNTYDHVTSTPPHQAFLTHNPRDSRDSSFHPDAASRSYAGHARSVNGRHMNDSHDFSAPPGLQPFLYSTPSSARNALDNTVALGHHISALFASEDFSDVSLQMTLENDHSSTSVAGHKVVLARSLPLYRLIAGNPGTTQIDVMLSGKWHDLRAFQEALSWLYVCSLLGDASDVPLKVPGDNNSARLRYALAYVEAGQFLSLLPVSQRGVEISSTLLAWDNLHIALEYALEGGLHQSWTQGHAAGMNGNHVNGASSPVHDPAATQLLYSIMDFMAASLPRDLFIDTSAPDLKELARLPEALAEGPAAQERSVTHRSSRSINDPRLSRIRFGELGGPSALARLISSVLFSLPFPLLSILVQHPVLTERVGATGLANLARSVVAEREVRRIRASQVLSKDEQGKSNELLYQKEVITSNNGSPSGIQLSRQHIPDA
ncbi:hypothetical protein AMS68_001235 [Peltaster fructicola]|uniref:BTB domain-containing protein n=1 Tax=Peltaster fructicola TaxID=286661 RepID=A0A6H0XM69_9PEZI|nr:hypothetical protein AMS68_001235 [Peltaster fructicola]